MSKKAQREKEKARANEPRPAAGPRAGLRAVRIAGGSARRWSARTRGSTSPSAAPATAPHAYKDVDRVVQVVHDAGLARKVVRLRPVGVVKG